MKRIVSFIVCLTLALSFLVVTAFAERTLAGFAGDVNSDTVTDILDVVTVRYKIINGTEFDKNISRCADLNCDSKIDVIDVAMIRKMIVNKVNIPEVYITENETIIDPSKPVIALTFDDGPNATTTRQVL